MLQSFAHFGGAFCGCGLVTFGNILISQPIVYQTFPLSESRNAHNFLLSINFFCFSTKLVKSYPSSKTGCMYLRQKLYASKPMTIESAYESIPKTEQDKTADNQLSPQKQQSKPVFINSLTFAAFPIRDATAHRH